MSIAPVGTLPALRPTSNAASLPTGGAQAVGYNPDAYYPGYAPPQPAPAAPANPGVASSGLNIGRMGSWGLGALAAARFVLPHLGSPAGWIKLLVIGGGALVGNFVWNKLEKDVPNGTAGSVGHVGTIAGGAVGGFLIGRSILGDNPAGWLVGGVIGLGAYVGHRVYGMMAR